MSEYPATLAATRVYHVRVGSQICFHFERTAAAVFDHNIAWTTKDPCRLVNAATLTAMPDATEYFQVILTATMPDGTALRVLDSWTQGADGAGNTSSPDKLYKTFDPGLWFPAGTKFNAHLQSFGLATTEQYAWFNFQYLKRQFDQPDPKPAQECSILDRVFFGGCDL